MLIISACKDNFITPTPIDYTYAPLEVNSWIEYEIQEINIDKPSNVYDTSTYYIKEIITEKYSDITNKEAYRVERYKRKDLLSNWIIKDVWTVQIDNNRYIKTEENIKFIRLIFPVELYKKWDGNIYNTFDELEYEITSLNYADSINNINFDSLLTVTHEDELNQIEKKYSIERFAKNIGLVYKESIDIYADATPYDDPIEKRIKTATIYYQKVIDYGND